MRRVREFWQASLLGLGLFLGAGILALGAGPAAAQTKVALVIGNGAYRGVAPLVNPTNDAGDVAASFTRLGFEVRRVTDGTFDDMRRALPIGARNLPQHGNLQIRSVFSAQGKVT